MHRTHFLSLYALQSKSFTTCLVLMSARLQMAEFKDLPVVQAVVSILYASDENVDVLQIAQTAIEQSTSKPGDENDEYHDANLSE